MSWYQETKEIEKRATGRTTMYGQPLFACDNCNIEETTLYQITYAIQGRFCHKCTQEARA